MDEHSFEVIKDPEYGYLRIDPLPTVEEVNNFYLQEFYSIVPPEKNDSALESQNAIFNNIRFELLRATIEETMGSLEGLSLLDIGCGYCQALLYFSQHGCQVTGIDPAPEAVQYGISKGLHVIRGSMDPETSPIQISKFEIILILNVLEHLRKPGEFLKWLRMNILKKDGLIIIDVPNEYNDFQITANSEHQLHEWWLAPPCHINYFSKNSLCSLLEQSGFKIVSSEASFPMELFLLMGDVYVGNSDLGRVCHSKRIRFEETLIRHNRLDTLRRFYKALASCGLGRQITVYAQSV